MESPNKICVNDGVKVGLGSGEWEGPDPCQLMEIGLIEISKFCRFSATSWKIRVEIIPP